MFVNLSNFVVENSNLLKLANFDVLRDGLSFWRLWLRLGLGLNLFLEELFFGDLKGFVY